MIDYRSAYEGALAHVKELEHDVGDWKKAFNDLSVDRSRDYWADAAMGGYCFNALAKEVRAENDKWWRDPATGDPIERNKGEMIALMHSELSEMLEAVRKDSMDDKLAHRKGEEVEMADLVIRALDFAGEYGLDLDGAIAEKRAFNRQRKDHSREARLAAGGKKF
jgi:hypothetical protein